MLAELHDVLPERDFGGKAAQLGQAHRHGLPVPPGRKSIADRFSYSPLAVATFKAQAARDGFLSAFILSAASLSPSARMRFASVSRRPDVFPASHSVRIASEYGSRPFR